MGGITLGQVKVANQCGDLVPIDGLFIQNRAMTLHGRRLVHLGSLYAVCIHFSPDRFPLLLLSGHFPSRDTFPDSRAVATNVGSTRIEMGGTGSTWQQPPVSQTEVQLPAVALSSEHAAAAGLRRRQHDGQYISVYCLNREARREAQGVHDGTVRQEAVRNNTEHAR